MLCRGRCRTLVDTPSLKLLNHRTLESHFRLVSWRTFDRPARGRQFHKITRISDHFLANFTRTKNITGDNKKHHLPATCSSRAWPGRTCWWAGLLRWEWCCGLPEGRSPCRWRCSILKQWRNARMNETAFKRVHNLDTASKSSQHVRRRDISFTFLCKSTAWIVLEWNYKWECVSESTT